MNTSEAKVTRIISNVSSNWIHRFYKAFDSFKTVPVIAAIKAKCVKETHIESVRIKYKQMLEECDKVNRYHGSYSQENQRK